jgi:hypothetical protein
MKHVTLTIADIERINGIRRKLSIKQLLTSSDQDYLLDFLSQVPLPESDLLQHIPYEENIKVKLWDIVKIEAVLVKWSDLFHNIPGFDFSPAVYVIDQQSDVRLLHKNVIMTAAFAPTLSRNERPGGEGFEVHLKDDGTASFWFPTFEDAESYPELFNFKGSWKEAYLLLIEILKKGWPMEEFPAELLPLLKK